LIGQQKYPPRKDNCKKSGLILQKACSFSLTIQGLQITEQPELAHPELNAYPFYPEWIPSPKHNQIYLLVQQGIFPCYSSLVKFIVEELEEEWED